MILTYNVKHGLDLSEELEKARRIAKYGVEHGCRSSKDVSFFGMKSVLSNAVLRKYVGCRTLKEVHNVVIPVNNQAFRLEGDEIYIPCLKARFRFDHHPEIECVKHIELDSVYAHVACQVREAQPRATQHFIGVDRNTTGHVAVAANPDTGKVAKLGKSCNHIHKKYCSMRRRAQRQGKSKRNHKYRKAKQFKKRESHIVKNINHQISKEIVDMAVKDNATIVLEDLKSSRDTFVTGRGFRYSLNSWSFYQLQQFIEYKAKLQGIPVMYVPPECTSTECSRCGREGKRRGKTFVCPHCGHADHADVNAGFNIAIRGRLLADRDVGKGSTDAPNGGMAVV